MTEQVQSYETIFKGDDVETLRKAANVIIKITAIAIEACAPLWVSYLQNRMNATHNKETIYIIIL